MLPLIILIIWITSGLITAIRYYRNQPHLEFSDLMVFCFIILSGPCELFEWIQSKLPKIKNPIYRKPK